VLAPVGRKSPTSRPYNEAVRFKSADPLMPTSQHRRPSAGGCPPPPPPTRQQAQRIGVGTKKSPRLKTENLPKGFVSFPAPLDPAATGEGTRKTQEKTGYWSIASAVFVNVILSQICWTYRLATAVNRERPLRPGRASVPVVVRSTANLENEHGSSNAGVLRHLNKPVTRTGRRSCDPSVEGTPIALPNFPVWRPLTPPPLFPSSPAPAPKVTAMIAR